MHMSDEEESTSTPRSGGHIQFNDRKMDLCLMEVKKIAENKVLSTSDNIKTILESKLPGSLQYKRRRSGGCGGGAWS